MSDSKSLSLNGIQVIARAASILRVLKDDNSGLSLGQIAERTSLARSTVQRIINALTLEGFVMAGQENGNLRLGPEIQAMASASRLDITKMIHPLLATLSATTGETVDLAVYRHDHMAFIDQIVGSHRLRAVASIGEQFPMTTTANGKASLAIMTDQQIEDIAMRELRQTGRGIRRLGQIMKEIAAIRKQGIGYDIDEQTDGISAIGISFKDAQGDIYAISIPVPSYRFDKKKPALLRALAQTKTDLATLQLTLNHQPPKDLN